MPMGFAQFVRDLRYEDLPENVLHTLRRSLLDTMGTAAIGSTTGLSAKARTFARRWWCSAPDAPSSRLLFDGGRASPAGAALAGAFTIDSIDAHDGYSAVKGHAGSAVFPAIFAVADMLLEHIAAARRSEVLRRHHSPSPTRCRIGAASRSMQPSPTTTARDPGPRSGSPAPRRSSWASRSTESGRRLGLLNTTDRAAR